MPGRFAVGIELVQDGKRLAPESLAREEPVAEFVVYGLTTEALGGEIASIGFLANDNPGIDFFSLKLTSATFRNIAVGDRVGLEALSRAMAATKLKPIVDKTFAFDSAREAFAYLESGAHFGKVVIRVA